MNLKKPPMGWNSYDYYDTTVNEEQVRGNADYMAAHLKEYGWEYVVVDIAWYSYEAGEQRERFSMFRSAMWRWMNIVVYCHVLNAFHPLPMAKVLAHWRIMCTGLD